jgi:hypothetical protein
VAAVVLRYLVNRTGRGVIEDHWQGQPETLDRVLRLFGRAELTDEGVRE